MHARPTKNTKSYYLGKLWKTWEKMNLLNIRGKSKKNITGYLKFSFKFVFPMMVKKNICCFGDIIGKTDLCNEISFS